MQNQRKKLLTQRQNARKKDIKLVNLQAIETTKKASTSITENFRICLKINCSFRARSYDGCNEWTLSKKSFTRMILFLNLEI